ATACVPSPKSWLLLEEEGRRQHPQQQLQKGVGGFYGHEPAHLQKIVVGLDLVVLYCDDTAQQRYDVIARIPYGRFQGCQLRASVAGHRSVYLFASLLVVVLLYEVHHLLDYVPSDNWFLHGFSS